MHTRFATDYANLAKISYICEYPAIFWTYNAKLSHREIQLYLLDILKAVDAFCAKEGIRYSMAYGTLLGAVRHKGFIPWDDDIDLLMPRPDYERFVATFGKDPDSRYRCLCHKEGVKGDRFVHFSPRLRTLVPKVCKDVVLTMISV